MRRGCQFNISGKGATGFNKPPPSPLSHLTANRMRLHAHELKGTNIKDRLGSSREHSPNLGSSMPLSPSHLNSREKSPKDLSQILQDCSMCIAAYVQSLNTVCGTACRLAQCLTQVDVDNGSNEATGGSGLPLYVLLKDAAELWEGVARVVGVTSTNVKNQMLMLLQDAQNRNNLEYNESARKAEFAKTMRTLLATFLSLQCQFSLVVFERFSGMLQQLKEESDGPNVLPNDSCASTDHEGGGGPWPNPTLISHHHCSSSPPHQNAHYSHVLPHQSLPHQHLFQQQLAMQHQSRLQQVLHAANKTSLNGGSCVNEESASQPSGGGFVAAFQTPFNPSWASTQLCSSHHSNTLSPALYTAEEIDSLNETLSRRWSMGCSTTIEEGCQKKSNSLDPLSLIVNRRWSVPETTEYDPSWSLFWDLYSLSQCNYSGSMSSGKNSQNRSFNKENSQVISRESSCTRSPSHSRSVTPDQSRRVSVVSSEELQDIIDLLSFPLHDEKSESLLSSTGKSFCNIQNSKDDPGNTFYQRICENNTESHVLLSPDTLSGKGVSTIWTDTCSEKVEAESHSGTQNRRINKDRTNQISTSLWPPTDSLPGVTLTECVGDTDKNLSSPWSGCHGVENYCGERSFTSSLNRDSVSRASWPISSLSNCYANDMSSGNPKGSREGWPSRPCVSTFRRHSTDAPYFLSQVPKSPMLTKTRSFENIVSKIHVFNEAQ